METIMNLSAYLDMETLESTHWWYKGRRSIINSLLLKLDLPDSPSILEVGSGTGGNIAMLSKLGHVTAIEMNELAFKISKNKYSSIADIRLGQLPSEIPNLSKKFDLICLFDVLEHIKNDTLSLLQLKNLLKTNGKIVLTVPAYQWLWSQHDVHHHHYRRYTKNNIIQSSNYAELEVSRISYFNTLLFPIAAIVRLLDRVLNIKNNERNSLPPKIINTILTHIFSSESVFLKHINFSFGLSLFITLKFPENTP